MRDLSVNKKRDASYDFIRGCLIILVMWGHICAYSSGQNYGSNIFTLYVRLFQMPLFIFISGYFQQVIGTKHDLWKMIKKTTIGIVVPLMLFCFLSYVINKVINIYVIY